MKVDALKIISIVIFLIIARNTSEHVILPMVFGLLTSVAYVFSEFKAASLFIIAAIGLCLVLFTLTKKNKVIIILGYVLTYMILIKSLSDSSLYNDVFKELYFFITTGLYITISLIVIAKTLHSKRS